VPVRLLGEDLVLFRDNEGELGLIGRQLPASRRRPVLWPARGQRPALPVSRLAFRPHRAVRRAAGRTRRQTMHEQIRTTAYPVIEKNGIVWAYMGRATRRPSRRWTASPRPRPCLRLQGACGSATGCRRWRSASTRRTPPSCIASCKDEDPKEGYGKQFRDKAGQTEMPMTQLLREYPRPEIRVDETDYGLRLIALRHLDDGRTHVRVTNQIFPEAICIPMSREMTITQWHVPVDDETCYWYSMFTSFGPGEQGPDARAAA
jgi:phthalate 4,5-dioxygenase oxygenase subunit